MTTTKPNKVLPKPVDWDDLYPGRFLKCGHLHGERVTYTIAEVFVDELLGDKGEEQKGIMRFREIQLELALNKTNGKYLMAMFGRRVQEWKGKRVTLTPDKTKFGPNVVDCIRIYGSPDIDKPISVEIKMPKKKATHVVMQPTKDMQAAPKAKVPTVEEYEKCAELDAFEILESRRGDGWRYLTNSERAPLKEASDTAKDRLTRPTAEEPSDGKPAAAEHTEIDLAAALAQLQKPSDAAALDATWAAVCDHFADNGEEVPVQFDAAYQISKEQFA